VTANKKTASSAPQVQHIQRLHPWGMTQPSFPIGGQTLEIVVLQGEEELKHGNTSFVWDGMIIADGKGYVKSFY